MSVLVCPDGSAVPTKSRPGARSSRAGAAAWGVPLAVVLGALAACQSEDGGAPFDDEAAGADTDAGTQEEGDAGGIGRMRGTSPQNETPDAEEAWGGTLPPAPSVIGDAGTGVLPTLVTAEKACDLQAERYCGRLRTCSSFLLQALYGKEETCRTRHRFACLTDAAAGDSGWRAVDIVRCAQSYDDASCADLMARRGPVECRVAGSRPNGMSCGSHAQCQSGFCELSADKCGVCAPRVAAGGDCIQGGDERCMSGHICGPLGRCVRPGTRNEACHPLRAPCEAILACVDGKCGTPVGAEKECESSAWCNTLAGEACVARAAGDDDRICRAAPVAQPTESCGDGEDITHMCVGGAANCRKDAYGDLRCVAPAKDGEPCGSVADGRTCIAPARCIAGRCRLGAADGC